VIEVSLNGISLMLGDVAAMPDFLTKVGLAEKAISIAPQLIPGTISR
jgi:hypothetical protein